MYTLIWSPEYHSYKLLSLHKPGVPLLQGDTEAWFIWLTTNNAFTFHGQHGSLFLQKERRPRGRDGYWYAYRRQAKRMIKKYVGQSAKLSIAHLEAVAQAIGVPAHHQADTEPSHIATDIHLSEPCAPLNQQTVARTERSWNILASSSPGVPQYSDALLLPKLRPPRLHALLVSRERLLALLDAGSEHKLTLLSAPAGFGKTTLVSSWIAVRGSNLPPVAWIALDSGDNDPLRFWHYLIAACQSFQPDGGNMTRSLLQMDRLPSFRRLSLETMFTALLNVLALLPGRGILVLEDYHVIIEPEIHQAMGFFLEHLPAQLHLILVTRAEPPLPLARLRAHGDLVELGASHLRFSQEEAHAFLRQTLPFALDDAAFASLLSRTEGWITGLRLITFALQDQRQFSEQEVEQRFAIIIGHQRSIVDYLVTDVLASQPESLQTFLLQTTALSRLTASLCDAVTGRNDSALLLAQIERTNLFLLSLDNGGQWYRYHALFAEAMQHEARLRLGQAALREVASRASRWYEQQTLFADSVDAALFAEELERAATLMVRMIEIQSLHWFSELHTLLRWLTSLPEAMLRNYPTLCLAYTLALLFSSEPRTPALRSRLEIYLHMAESSLYAAGNTSGLAEALALRAFMSWLLNDFTTAMRCAQEALALLPADEKFWRSIILAGMGADHQLAGRLYDAYRTIQEARTLMEVVGNSGGLRSTLYVLGNIAASQGKSQHAAELYRRMLHEAGNDHLDRCCALAGLAALSYEWNDLATAEQMAQEASLLSQELNHELLLVSSTITLAQVQHARGEIPQARDLLLYLATHLTQPLWQREIGAWLARFAFASGDLATLQRQLISLQAFSSEPTEAQQERDALLSARLLIAQGKALEALDVLERWHILARSQTRTRSELEILLLLTQAKMGQRRMREAQKALVEALVIAQPSNYRRLFLDEGEPMAQLLKTLLSGIHKPSLLSFLRSLLHAFPAGDYSAHSIQIGAPVEPLSPQERRVLRLLVAGCSNPEIADQFSVSRNTIKTQVKSIYYKLGVNSRLAASEAARQWHLL
jgi:LuxR family maltose regulon positive regulatory protein